MSEENQQVDEPTTDRLIHKISEKDFQLLKVAQAKQTEDYKLQIKRNRENQRRHLEVETRKIDREIQFKKEELASGIVEKDVNFADGLRPRLFVENDVDMLEVAKSDVLLQLGDLTKAEEAEK